MVNNRNSSFELLRIICIFEVLLMHAIDGFLNSLGGIDLHIITILQVIFNASSSCLMIISGYFGIKFSVKKIINIEFVFLFWNMISLIQNYIDGRALGRQELMSTFLPVLSNRSWFITGYVYILILSPFINEYLERIDKKRMQQLLGLGLLLFSIFPSLFYFEITGTNGKGIIHLLLMYLVGRYIKLYGDVQRKKIGNYIVYLIAIIVVAGILNVIAEMINMRFWFSRDCSIFIIIVACLLVIIFSFFNFKSKIIDFFASNIISVIIGERIVSGWIEKIYLYLLPDGGQLEWYILVLTRVLAVFLLCVLIEKVRYLLFNGIEDKIIKYIKQIADKQGSSNEC